MIANPLVSTIVVSYNHFRFVLDTLESVKAQTYNPTQVIIVDDCSTDESVATIEQWLHDNGMHCTFIRHQNNQGLCKSLNDALAVANGKYLSMTAADDIWLPDKIARQVEIMESQPDHVGMLYSDAFQIDEHGHPLPDMFIEAHAKLPEMPQGQVLSALLERNFIPAMTTLIRRSCYEQVGLYDENLPWEDWDMWMRIARQYSFVYSPTPSAKYRIHAESYSHIQPERMLKNSFQVCFKQLRLGNLSEDHRSTLIVTLLSFAMQLYRRNDPDASHILLDLWHATGDTRAVWMYWFARLNVSFRIFERANGCRRRLRSLVGNLAASMTTA